MYMKARWMNPTTGTFLSVDPLVADYADPQSYNAYAYARNNPVRYTDPTGLLPFEEIIVYARAGAPLDVSSANLITSTFPTSAHLVGGNFIAGPMHVHYAQFAGTGGGYQTFKLTGGQLDSSFEEWTVTWHEGATAINEALGLPPDIGPFDPIPTADLGPGHGLIPNAFNEGGRFGKAPVNSAAVVALPLGVAAATAAAPAVAGATAKALAPTARAAQSAGRRVRSLGRTAAASGRAAAARGAVRGAQFAFGPRAGFIKGLGVGFSKGFFAGDAAVDLPSVNPAFDRGAAFGEAAGNILAPISRAFTGFP